MVRRFSWFGRRGGYTSDDIDRLAGMELNVLAQFHRSNDTQKQLKDAEVLFRAGGKPYIYFPTTHNLETSSWFNVTADHRCCLMDGVNAIVKHRAVGQRQLDRYLYDWSIHEWRESALALVSDWFSKDYVCGIAFDGLNLLSPRMKCRHAKQQTVYRIGNLLDSSKLQAYNNGLKQFLISTKKLGINVIANCANGGMFRRSEDSWGMRFQVNRNRDLYHLLPGWIHREQHAIDPTSGIPNEQWELDEDRTWSNLIEREAVTANINPDIWEAMAETDRKNRYEVAVHEFMQLPNWQNKLFNFGPYNDLYTEN